MISIIQIINYHDSIEGSTQSSFSIWIVKCWTQFWKTAWTFCKILKKEISFRIEIKWKNEIRKIIHSLIGILIDSNNKTSNYLLFIKSPKMFIFTFYHIFKSWNLTKKKKMNFKNKEIKKMKKWIQPLQVIFQDEGK